MCVAAEREHRRGPGARTALPAGLLPAAVEAGGECGELFDVSAGSGDPSGAVGGDTPQRRLRCAAEPQWRPSGGDRGRSHLLFTPPDGGDTFHQCVQGTPSNAEVQVARPVVVFAGSGRETEMQPSGARDPVQGRRGLGEQCGVGVQRGQQHTGDQPDAFGGPGCRGQCDQRFRSGPGQAVAGDQRGESPLLGPSRPRHQRTRLNPGDMTRQPYAYLHVPCLFLDNGPGGACPSTAAASASLTAVEGVARPIFRSSRVWSRPTRPAVSCRRPGSSILCSCGRSPLPFLTTPTRPPDRWNDSARGPQASQTRSPGSSGCSMSPRRSRFWVQPSRVKSFFDSCRRNRRLAFSPRRTGRSDQWLSKQLRT